MDCTPVLFPIIMRLKQKCVATEERIQKEQGLSPAEMHSLLMLTAGETLLGHDLAHRLNLSPSRTSRVISKLHKNGFISVTIPESNRRTQEIRLTRSGTSIKKKIITRLCHCEQMILEGFSTAEQQGIIHSLTRLTEKLAQNNA